MAPSKNATTFIGTCLLVVVTMVGGCLLAAGRRSYSDELTFDAEAWRSERKHPGNVTERTLRVRMVDDLVEREELVGREVSEVVATLGEPDQSYDRAGTSELVYYLGRGGSWLHAAPEMLVLGSVDGKISNVRIVED